MNPFEIDSTSDTVQLRLNGELTIEQVCALHPALLAALTPPRPLMVDMAALIRVDAAVLQLLFAAARVSAHARLSAGSPVWTAALQRHGLTDPFAQP